MSQYTDEQINQARAFYANFLRDNNMSPGEHASVLALAAYAAEISIGQVSDSLTGDQGSNEPALSVEETEAFKEIKDLHDGILKERDHNWNELQKANKQIELLKAQLALATKPAESKQTEGKVGSGKPSNFPDEKVTVPDQPKTN